MNLKKSLATMALGLTLATSIAGIHGMAPAHADGGHLPNPRPYNPNPFLTEQAGNCVVGVTGHHFTPSGKAWVILADNVTGATKQQVVTISANGTVSVLFGSDHMGPSISVIAQDLATGKITDSVDDLTFCIK